MRLFKLLSKKSSLTSISTTTATVTSTTSKTSATITKIKSIPMIYKLSFKTSFLGKYNDEFLLTSLSNLVEDSIDFDGRL